MATISPPATLPSRIGDEGAHLHHAVAAGELALGQVLRQVGELDRTEQRGVQAHEEGARQQDGTFAVKKPDGGQHHDADLQPLHEQHQAALVVLVRELPLVAENSRKAG
jgi:hypothetical protein